MSTKGRRSIKVATICGQCGIEVKEENEENIQCDKCAKIFHSICTKLNKRQYEYLLANEDEEYVCHLCVNKSSGSVRDEIKEMKTEINKKLDTITTAIEFMSKQYDILFKNIAENNKKLEMVQKENRVLKNEITTLKTSMKILNDHRVRNDCIVRGVEVDQKLSAVDTILDISKKIGLNLKEENIDDAYFFKKRGDRKNEKQTMVVKFSNKNNKEKFMMSKPKLKENDETKTIYVNDYLSRETMSLFNYAKTLKTIGYAFVYTNGARVYAKKSEITKPKLIRTEEDVDEIMTGAATTRTKRRSMNQSAVAVDESDGEDNAAAFLSPA